MLNQRLQSAIRFELNAGTPGRVILTAHAAPCHRPMSSPHLVGSTRAESRRPLPPSAGERAGSGKMVQGGTRALHQPGAALQKVPRPGFATYVGIDADRLARIRLPSPAAALAGGIEGALERIGILDGARIPPHLETGQQFDITS